MISLLLVGQMKTTNRPSEESDGCPAVDPVTLADIQGIVGSHLEEHIRPFRRTGDALFGLLIHVDNLIAAGRFHARRCCISSRSLSLLKTPF